MQDQIEELRQRFRSLGIASYRISGLDEDQSLLSYIREKNSFRYGFVRCPYSRSKNLIWRLMKMDIWRPTFPMGYFGSKGFIFDYLGEDPLGEATKIAGILLNRRYEGRKMAGDMMERVSFRKVREDKVPVSKEDIEYLKSRNVIVITVGG